MLRKPLDGEETRERVRASKAEQTTSEPPNLGPLKPTCFHRLNFNSTRAGQILLFFINKLCSSKL